MTEEKNLRTSEERHPARTEKGHEQGAFLHLKCGDNQGEEEEGGSGPGFGTSVSILLSMSRA